MLECRNQPVSMAIAVNRPAATSGVYVPPSAAMAFMTRIPVASADESLKTVAPRSSSLTWWSMTTRGPGKLADEAGHVAELVPRRQVEDDGHLAIGEFGRVDAVAEVLEQGPRRGRGSRTEEALGWS